MYVLFPRRSAQVEKYSELECFPLSLVLTLSLLAAFWNDFPLLREAVLSEFHYRARVGCGQPFPLPCGRIP